MYTVLATNALATCPVTFAPGTLVKLFAVTLPVPPLIDIPSLVAVIVVLPI